MGPGLASKDSYSQVSLLTQSRCVALVAFCSQSKMQTVDGEKILLPVTTRPMRKTGWHGTAMVAVVW